MEIGVSTASFFLRKHNEDALKALNSIDAKVAEVFLETFSQYDGEYGKKLNKYVGDMRIHSVHVVTTQYEPQLFSANELQAKDAFDMFENVLRCAKELGANNYTLHGKAYFKKTYSMPDEIGRFIDRFNIMCELSAKYNVSVCLENVFWCMYSYVGFFDKIRDFCPMLKTCLDVKQAIRSGEDPLDYLDEMGDRINTVHLSDFKADGKMCLPGRGVYDFERLFKRLKDVGFNGNMLIEVYKDDFGDESELKDSLEFLRKLKEKVFQR